MTADVRTYKAPNLQAALDIVRTELGPDAVILHTRQLETRRLWPWSARRSEVEVIAGRGVSGDAPNRMPVSPQPEKPRVSTPTIPTNWTPSASEDDLAPPPPLLGATTTRPRNNVVPPKWSPDDVIADDEPLPTPVLNRTVLPRTSETAPSEPAADTIAARSRLTTLDAGPSRETIALQQRLDTLQQMILDLGRERSGRSLQDVPSELFPLYTRLVEAEVDADLARELVGRIKERATRDQLSNQRQMTAMLAAVLEQELRVGPPITAARGRRKVVALVGPTGVGKTTTLAKLAANFRLRDGLRVGLITVDTYRVAAVEQLRTYAELIDLPMCVVTQPTELPRALDQLKNVDLVLIDTAGRSPKDDVRIQELRDVLSAGPIDEVHLVLSLASGLPVLKTAATNFQSLGITSLMLTKLDEATGYGSVVNVAWQLKTPISYITTGQNVPDDIEPAQRTRLARLILGQDNLTPSLPTAV